MRSSKTTSEDCIGLSFFCCEAAQRNAGTNVAACSNVRRSMVGILAEGERKPDGPGRRGFQFSVLSSQNLVVGSTENTRRGGAWTGHPAAGNRERTRSDYIEFILLPSLRLSLRARSYENRVGWGSQFLE